MVYDVTNQVSIQIFRKTKLQPLRFGCKIWFQIFAVCKKKTICYSVQASFDNIRKWLDEISRYAGDHVTQNIIITIRSSSPSPQSSPSSIPSPSLTPSPSSPPSPPSPPSPSSPPLSLLPSLPSSSSWVSAPHR